MSDSGWGSRRNVAPYLGVTIVVVIGFWGILVPLLMAFPGAPIETIASVAGGLAILVAVLWSFTPASELPSSIYGWVLNRKSKGDGLDGYEPITKRVKRTQTHAQGPPSIEEIRDIKGSTNNWVPTGTQSPRKIMRSRRLGSPQPGSSTSSAPQAHPGDSPKQYPAPGE